jgi:hypothetical protein
VIPRLPHLAKVVSNSLSITSHIEILWGDEYCVNSSKHRYTSHKTRGVEQRPAFTCVLGPPYIHSKATVSLVLPIPLSPPPPRLISLITSVTHATTACRKS